MQDVVGAEAERAEGRQVIGRAECGVPGATEVQGHSATAASDLSVRPHTWSLAYNAQRKKDAAHVKGIDTSRAPLAIITGCGTAPAGRQSSSR